MDFDNFLASPRWEILKLISEKPSSPVEISGALSTTVSYVSQQLKLLEIAGIVKKQRTGSVEKGKPRTLFSISNEFAYIVALTDNYSGKKLIVLNENQKTIIKIWMIENQNLHTPLEKFFWNIEPFLNDIESIFLDFSKLTLKIVVVSEKPIKTLVESAIKKTKENFGFEVVSPAKNADFSSLYSLYSKKALNQIELKGGKRRNE